MTMTGKKYTKKLLNYTSTNREKKIVKSRLQCGSNTKTGDALGIPRRTIDRVINKVVERAQLDGADEGGQPKILLIDIETAPMMTYLWSLWQNGVQPAAIETTSYILSWSAKW